MEIQVPEILGVIPVKGKEEVVKPSDHTAVLTPAKVKGKEGGLGEESQKVLASPLGRSRATAAS